MGRYESTTYDHGRSRFAKESAHWLKSEIARLCGLARQNTNRALHKLEEAGLLRIRYGVIEVLDLEGLQNYSREP